MKTSIRKGFSFGLTSGVITTLGLMVGLFSSTHSRLAVIGGILSIAIADACSDALGIHMSEESTLKKPHSIVWETTFATLFFKAIFALIFIIPVLLLSLQNAMIVSIMVGLTIIIVHNYNLALRKKVVPLELIIGHLSIAILVIVITYWVGRFIAYFFV